MATLKTIRFIGARLSTNPDTKVVQHPQGVKGNVNITQKGKMFFVLDYRGVDGQRALTKSILVWADDNGRFDTSGDDYNEMLKTGDLDFEGYVMTLTKEDGILPYTVEGKTFDYVKRFIANEPEAVANAVKEFNKQTLNRNENTNNPTGNTGITKQDELAALRIKLVNTTAPQIKAKIEDQIKALELELGITPAVVTP